MGKSETRSNCTISSVTPASPHNVGSHSEKRSRRFTMALAAKAHSIAANPNRRIPHRLAKNVTESPLKLFLTRRREIYSSGVAACALLGDEGVVKPPF